MNLMNLTVEHDGGMEERLVIKCSSAVISMFRSLIKTSSTRAIKAFI